MKSNLKSSYFIISTILLILSIIFFVYSKFNLKYSKIKLVENKGIEIELLKKHNELKSINEKILLEDGKLSKNSNEFFNRYGFQYDRDSLKQITLEKSRLEQDRIKVTEDMRKLIINYSNYFKSNVYDMEDFDSVIGNYKNLSEPNAEKFNNIIKDLEIKNLFNESDGNFQYLENLNGQDSNLYLYFFYIAMNSKDLNLFSKGESVEPHVLYNQIYQLYFSYKLLEDKGYNTGDLKAENLIYLKQNFDILFESYYRLTGLINSLKGGQNG